MPKKKKKKGLKLIDAIIYITSIIFVVAMAFFTYFNNIF